MCMARHECRGYTGTGTSDVYGYGYRGVIGWPDGVGRWYRTGGMWWAAGPGVVR